MARPWAKEITRARRPRHPARGAMFPASGALDVDVEAEIGLAVEALGVLADTEAELAFDRRLSSVRRREAHREGRLLLLEHHVLLVERRLRIRDARGRGGELEAVRVRLVDVIGTLRGHGDFERA